MAHPSARAARRARPSVSRTTSASTVTAVAAAVKSNTRSSADMAVLPLGALMLAASVGSWAQTTSTADKTLAPVTVREKAEMPEGKDALQTTRSTVGKGNQAIRDIPQSLNVVTEKLLDDKKIDNLNDALRLTAGVTFSAAENGTMQDTFIRGFSVAQVGDLLIDGMKDASLYERETFNLDRIEVLRGSASMIFGRGSTGGVVNQVMKKPILIDQHDVELSLGGDGYARATGDFNLKTGEDAALRINVMNTGADNRGQRIDKFGIAPSYRWGIGSADEFTVGAYYLNYNNRPKAGLRYTTIGSIVDPREYYGTSSDFSRGTAQYVFGQHTHRFDDGGELRTQLRTGTFQRENWLTQTAITGTTASFTPNTVITRSGLTPRKDEYDATYFQSDYSNSFNWFGLKNELLTGVDIAYEKADRYTQRVAGGNKGSTTIGRAFNGFSPLEPQFSPNATGGYKSKSLGVYAQDLVQVAEFWKVLGGVRVDSIKGDFRSQVNVAGVPTNQAASMSDTVGSYRTGVLFQPSPTQSYHFSYGTSFNTSADTYQYVSQQTANTPPEKSRNIEIGAKLDWLDGKLSTRAALFRTEKYNERTTDADFAGDAFLLSGKRHSSGLELEVVGRPSPEWEIYLSYAYIPETRIDKAGSNPAGQALVGQPFALVPKSSGSAWITYAPNAKWRIGGGVTASSENYALNGSLPNRATTARAPGYATFDALAEYRFTPDTYVQLNVTNLHNKLYAAELYRGFYVAGTPRTYKLTVGTRF